MIYYHSPILFAHRILLAIQLNQNLQWGVPLSKDLRMPTFPTTSPHNVYIYLSHTLTTETPSYGNRMAFQIEKVRSMCCGDSTNESIIHMATHMGTHIDFPLHFYKHGQSINDYPASFWFFSHPIFISIEPHEKIIYQEIVSKLNDINKNELMLCDILIVKTGIGQHRHKEKFWEDNYGFSPELYSFFKSTLPSLKIFGFDNISLSSFQHREVGKEAHLRFLNPASPILILEDMKLDEIETDLPLENIMVSPLRIENCDGAPCLVIGKYCNVLQDKW